MCFDDQLVVGLRVLGLGFQVFQVYGLGFGVLGVVVCVSVGVYYSPTPLPTVTDDCLAG